ncbi:MAG: hypothetical protein F4018_15315 [Acidobacteria bacterium]|nr:hypothetical protein [Acidobacteriota bacterium]MYH29662.1 hypothetical protein [Acidobacteriota bacterium]MYK89590.1 hypothetical protein [Acidobacteriota bacterium]
MTEVYEAFRAAGVDDPTAKAAAGAIPLAHDVATRNDIERVRREIAEFKADIYRALWLQGLGIVTLTVALLRIFP